MEISWEILEILLFVEIENSENISALFNFLKLSSRATVVNKHTGPT
jgi:hypothetical protein